MTLLIKVLLFTMLLNMPSEKQYLSLYEQSGDQFNTESYSVNENIFRERNRYQNSRFFESRE